MEQWRRIWRERILDFVGHPALGSADLRRMCSFTEMVAEEVGPQLVEWPDDFEHGEVAAAARSSVYMQVAYAVAGIGMEREARRLRFQFPDPSLDRRETELLAGLSDTRLLLPAVMRAARRHDPESVTILAYMVQRLNGESVVPPMPRTLE